MMAADDRVFLALMKVLAAQIPEMSMMLVGMLVSIAKWRWYPRPAALSFLAFGLLMFGSIVSMVLLHFPSLLGLENIVTVDDTLWIAIWAIRSCLFGASYLLLLWAVFSSRRQLPLVPPLPAR